MSQTQGIEDAPLFDQRDIDDLLLADDGPCISIYASTHPETDQKDKNRILYKDRVQEAAASLQQREIDRDQRRELIDQLERVGRTEHFWLYQQRGLAVFASPTRFKVRKLMRAPGDYAIVADSFHLRPLLRATQHWMRYQVLCLSVDRVALYECDREAISPVPLHRTVPTSLFEATGKKPRTPDRKDYQPASEDSRDLEQYFHRVDEAVREHHTGRSRCPLLLAALPEYQGLFREKSRNPRLLEARLERDPFHGVDQHGLGELAWAAVEPDLEANLDALVDRYRTGAAHAEGVDAIEQVARAAVTGQIEALLVEDGCCIGGRIDRESGDITYGEIEAPDTDDLLDDIAELVLRNQGRVQFLPRERMPSDTGVAAILRYAAAEEQAVV